MIIAFKFFIFIIISALIIVILNSICDIKINLHKHIYKDKSSIKYAKTTLLYGWITIFMLIGVNIWIAINLIKTFMDIASVHA